MSKGTNEVVEGVTRSIEGPWWELLTPSLLEIGHGFSGSVEDHSSLGCRKDQLCPAIGRIGPAFEVAETLEFINELRAGRQTQLGLCGEFGQSDAFSPDVPPHLQVREPDVVEPAIRSCAVEQVGPELEEEPAEDLTDGEPVGRESS